MLTLTYIYNLGYSRSQNLKGATQRERNKRKSKEILEKTHRETHRDHCVMTTKKGERPLEHPPQPNLLLDASPTRCTNSKQFFIIIQAPNYHTHKDAN